MEVFISWSGPRSEKVAEALRDWLPSVIQSVEPFMSASDIEKGSRWSKDISMHLEKAQFGLICLTPDNLEAPWLLFEAGALSKSVENSRVVPYLYQVSPTELQVPLAQFQAAVADKSSTLDIIKSINEASEGNKLEPTRLERAFETWWPELGKALAAIPETTEETPPSRSDRDILEEVLRLCRQMSRSDASNSQQEAWRSFGVDGLYTEPVDSTGALHTWSQPSRVAPARRETVADVLLRLLTQQSLEGKRSTRDRYSHGHSSSESEVQSSNDTDQEA